MNAPTNPEIGLSLRHDTFTTNYHDGGEGDVVLLIHGSGPGVSAYANWRLILPELAKKYRVLAPDVAGFGFTEIDGNVVPRTDDWVRHIKTFLDELGVVKVSIIGNSFGGALALWFASTYPAMVDRLILMGSVGASFELTDGLDAVWGYEPSVEAMENLLEIFTYDRSLLPANLGELRYQASVKPGAQERWESLFPAPRQQWIELLALSPDQFAAITHPTLLVHGREDQVIPLVSSMTLLQSIDDAQLHVFPHTGHWVQIERAADFTELATDFLAKAGK